MTWPSLVRIHELQYRGSRRSGRDRYLEMRNTFIEWYKKPGLDFLATFKKIHIDSENVPFCSREDVIVAHVVPWYDMFPHQYTDATVVEDGLVCVSEFLKTGGLSLEYKVYGKLLLHHSLLGIANPNGELRYALYGICSCGVPSEILREFESSPLSRNFADPLRAAFDDTGHPKYLKQNIQTIDTDAVDVDAIRELIFAECTESASYDPPGPIIEIHKAYMKFVASLSSDDAVESESEAERYAEECRARYKSILKSNECLIEGKSWEEIHRDEKPDEKAMDKWKSNEGHILRQVRQAGVYIRRYFLLSCVFRAIQLRKLNVHASSRPKMPMPPLFPTPNSRKAAPRDKAVPHQANLSVPPERTTPTQVAPLPSSPTLSVPARRRAQKRLARALLQGPTDQTQLDDSNKVLMNESFDLMTLDDSADAPMKASSSVDSRTPVSPKPLTASREKNKLMHKLSSAFSKTTEYFLFGQGVEKFSGQSCLVTGYALPNKIFVKTKTDTEEELTVNSAYLYTRQQLDEKLSKIQAAWLPGMHVRYAPPGLKWKESGTDRPTSGSNLTNAKLSKALKMKREFTQSEWDAFGITSLTFGDSIEVDGRYFKPDHAEDASTLGTVLGVDGETGMIRLKVYGSEEERDVEVWQWNIQRLGVDDAKRLLEGHYPSGLNVIYEGEPGTVKNVERIKDRLFVIIVLDASERTLPVPDHRIRRENFRVGRMLGYEYLVYPRVFMGDSDYRYTIWLRGELVSKSPNYQMRFTETIEDVARSQITTLDHAIQNLKKQYRSGSLVVLHSLKSKPELNRKVGHVQFFDETKFRFRVTLEEVGPGMLLSPQNIIPLSPGYLRNVLDLTAASLQIGLKWYSVDKPESGEERRSPKLSAALKEKTTFTKHNLVKFGLANLKLTDYIKSDSAYFQPEQGFEKDYQDTVQSLVLLNEISTKTFEYESSSTSGAEVISELGAKDLCSILEATLHRIDVSTGRKNLAALNMCALSCLALLTTLSVLEDAGAIIFEHAFDCLFNILRALAHDEVDTNEHDTHYFVPFSMQILSNILVGPGLSVHISGCNGLEGRTIDDKRIDVFIAVMLRYLEKDSLGTASLPDGPFVKVYAANILHVMVHTRYSSFIKNDGVDLACAAFERMMTVSTTETAALANSLMKILSGVIKTNVGDSDFGATSVIRAAGQESLQRHMQLIISRKLIPKALQILNGRTLELRSTALLFIRVLSNQHSFAKPFATYHFGEHTAIQMLEDMLREYHSSPFHHDAVLILDTLCNFGVYSPKYRMLHKKADGKDSVFHSWLKSAKMQMRRGGESAGDERHLRSLMSNVANAFV